MADISKAGEWLKVGKSVRRKSWLNPHARLQVVEGCLEMFYSEGSFSSGSRRFGVVDLTAKDWCLYKPKK